MIREQSLNGLAEIIVQAIQSEPYFEKEAMTQKIRAIIGAFRVKLSGNNYERIATPLHTAKMQRRIEMLDFELYFWKARLENIVGSDAMVDYFKLLDEKRLYWSGKMPINDMVDINEKHDELTKKIYKKP